MDLFKETFYEQEHVLRKWKQAIKVILTKDYYHKLENVNLLLTIDIIDIDWLN